MQKTEELIGGSNGFRRKYESTNESTDESAYEYEGKKNENKKNPYRFGAQVAAKTNNNCKICKYFEIHPKKFRGFKTPFAKHYGMGPGGCPRFMELDINMRREVV